MHFRTRRIVRCPVDKTWLDSLQDVSLHAQLVAEQFLSRHCLELEKSDEWLLQKKTPIFLGFFCALTLGCLNKNE